MLKKQLMRITGIWAVSLMMAACNPTTASNLPQDPQASSSDEPAASPSEEPGDPSAAPNTESEELPNTETAPAEGDNSTDPSATTPEPTDNSAGVTSPLQVTGAEVFDSFALDYSAGMKWVYSMSIPAPAVPGLPAGFEVPPTTGTMTQEVTSVKGVNVTIKVDTDVSGVKSSNETTFSTKDSGDYYNSSFAGEGEGTLSWSAVGSESVTVGAGTYNATKIMGKMDITTTQNGATVNLKQDITLWMASGVGMVKQIVDSTTDSSGGQINSVTNIELSSFNG